MPINLFHLFDSFYIDPWSLILDPVIFDPWSGDPVIRDPVFPGNLLKTALHVFDQIKFNQL